VHPPQELQPQDKKILEALLKTDGDKMKFLINIFTDPRYSLEEKEAALEELESFVEKQQNAIAVLIPSVNVLPPLLDGLRSPYEGIRWRSAWVLGTIVQNNPEAQKKALENQGLQVLLEAIKWELKEGKSLKVLNKLVYALSGLLSSQLQAQKELWELGGFSLLASILHTNPQQFVIAREPSEKPSGLLPPLEKQKAPTTSQEGVIQVEDEEDRVRDIADRIRKEKEQGAKEFQEVQYARWIRLTTKVIFVFFKLLSESDEFKLRFIGENNGQVLKTLIVLLDRQDELEMKDKILSCFEALLATSEEQTRAHIVQALKHPQIRVPLVEVLNRQRQRIAALEPSQHYDTASLLQKIDNILQNIQ